jgi:DNA-damage-inducible protein J
MGVTKMGHEARISSRIDADLKQQADSILAEIGIKPSQAIALFYTQIVRQRGLPLDLKIPNDELVAAIHEARDPKSKETRKRYDSTTELFDDLDF